MLFSQQVFLVAGLSRSGVSAAEFLLSRGAKLYAYDDAEGGKRAKSDRLALRTGLPHRT